MNEALMQPTYNLNNTGKYVIIKCLNGCQFSACYKHEYSGSEKHEKDLRFFRCI